MAAIGVRAIVAVLDHSNSIQCYFDNSIFIMKHMGLGKTRAEALLKTSGIGGEGAELVILYCTRTPKLLSKGLINKTFRAFNFPLRQLWDQFAVMVSVHANYLTPTIH